MGIFFLAFAVRSVALSRKNSAGTSRGSLAFVTKDFRDDTYYWCLVIFVKDLLIIVCAAILRDGVNQLVFCGCLCLAYVFLLGLVMPFTDRSANNSDLLTSLL